MCALGLLHLGRTCALLDRETATGVQEDLTVDFVGFCFPSPSFLNMGDFREILKSVCVCCMHMCVCTCMCMFYVHVCVCRMHMYLYVCMCVVCTRVRRCMSSGPGITDTQSHAQRLHGVGDLNPGLHIYTVNALTH